ncbi:transglutaminase domain-containing protein [Blastococcus sp. TF02A-26]|uniref:transglutaminase family protein n=1 Tax=Blastococcus sp. TF02A-26 TaxID=2250577 RepID=UPI000DE9C2FE|nr:transglutaminase domain-containing protein [Blastococcus sp. TF02A-26]RBY88522.1 transglutaminase domain-containing protein [Blastococcus sp. TF02A-26]
MTGPTSLAAVGRQDAGATLAAAGAVALGSASLSPVFRAADWVPGVLAAVAAVAAGGLVLRLAGPALWAVVSGGAPVPRWAALAVPLVPLGQLAALACALTALFAPDRALFGWVPTAGSLADLGGVLVDGSAQIREQFTPAEPLAGLSALTALMVGVLAVVVDLVAVGARQPALAAPALLALFCVPVSTVTGGVGLAAVALPTAGFALLLWSDQHLRLSEGRRRGGGARPATGALTALRTALLALVAALVLGSLVPVLGEGELADRWRSGGGGGGGTTGTSLDPAASLQGELTREDPIDLLRVESAVSDPGYLRAVALDVYDPELGWVLDEFEEAQSLDRVEALAPLDGETPSRVVEATVTVLEHEDRFLPVLSSPLDVQIDDAADWRFDRPSATVFGDGTETATGLRYTTTGVEARPTPEELTRLAEVSPGRPEAALAAPPLLDPVVTDLVTGLVAGLDAPGERVQAIYRYMTDPANGWVYSLTTDPGTTGDDLADFLENRRGYCEQYAGAMAAMVRAAGVPARVVLGYTPGIVQPDGSRLVTSNDAHAWVEVYFAGVGWVPYDPTPIDSDRAVALPWAPRPPDQEVDPRTDLPAAPLPAPAPVAPPADAGVPDSPTAAGEDDGVDWTGTVLPVAAAVLLTAAVLAAPAAVRVLQRRRRLATGDAGAVWDELAATAQDLGLPWDRWQTPRQIAGRLGERMPTPSPAGRGVHRADDPAAGAREAVARLARAEEAHSYAPPGAGPDRDELARTLHIARRGLLAAAERGTRLRALLWPASVPATLGADLRARGPRRLRGPLREPAGP